MNNTSHTLGIITVTYNAKLFIDEFIDCCLRQSHKNYILLIIDNNSNDGTKESIHKYVDNRIELLLNENNVGYAAACNQGIKYFKQIGVNELLFINNDTLFSENLFSDILNSRHKYFADAVTPRITYAEDPNRNWHAGGRLSYWKGFQGEHLGEGAFNDPLDNTPRLTTVASGCCVLFSMEVFDKVGTFDEKFFVYGEDTDMFIRMLRNKSKLLYDPTIIIGHKISLSTGGSQSDFSIHYYHRNQIYLIRKHLNPIYLPIQLIIILIKIFLRLIVRMDSPRHSKLRLRGMIEGFKI